MGRTVGELMASMSSQEFSMWAALDEEDQLGERDADFRAALVCATIANFAGKSSDKWRRPADFMPGLEKPVEPAAVDPLKHFTAVATSKKSNQ